MSPAKRSPWGIILAVLAVAAIAAAGIFAVRGSFGGGEEIPTPTVVKRSAPASPGPAPAPSDGGGETAEDPEPEPTEKAPAKGKAIKAKDVDATNPDAVAEMFASWMSKPGVKGKKVAESLDYLASDEAKWPLRGLSDKDLPDVTDWSVSGGGTMNAGVAFKEWDTRSYVLVGSADGADKAPVLEFWVGRPLVVGPSGEYDESIGYRVIGADYVVDGAPDLISVNDLNEGLEIATDAMLVFADPLRYPDPEQRADDIKGAFSDPESALKIKPLVKADRGPNTKVRLNSIYWFTIEGDEYPTVVVEGNYTDLSFSTGGTLNYRVLMKPTSDGEASFVPVDVIDNRENPRDLPEGSEEGVW